VLYERIAEARRVRLHRLIGERLEQGYGERAQEFAAELALHFERGRDYRRATWYLQHAAENAQRKNAYQEAISLATRGLQLLTEVADTPERVQQELSLQLALGDALGTIKGYTAPDVEKTVTRARVLCQQLGETPQLFPVLGHLWVFYLNRAEFQTARELAEQMMRLAQSAQTPLLLPWAHAALGGTLFFLGEMVSARTHFEKAIELYDPQQYPRFTGNRSDVRVDFLSYAALILWYLGYPDQALKRSQEAVALAEGLSHPFSLAFALAVAASFHSFRGEWQTAREQAEAVMTLSTEQGFPYWLAFGTTVWGEVLAEQGQVEEGIVQMQQGLADLRAMGAEMPRTSRLPMLAAAYAKVGRIEEGLNVVAGLLAFVDKAGAWMNEAELYRLKGTLTLQSKASLGQVIGTSWARRRQVQSKSQTNQNKPRTGLETSKDAKSQILTPISYAEAEACFLKAVELTRRQQAKSLELRAAMSLARLWQQQGKRAEAHHLLSEIYGWFGEGFDTKDLQEAKALLEELA
jgi:predicted ATPase